MGDRRLALILEEVYMMTERKANAKRLLEDFPDATLLNLINGQKLNVEKGKDFVIGRSLQCSLLIEESFMSRVHCIIKYENNNFVILNYSSSSGTYLNCKRMFSKNNPSILKNGDIIAFGKGNTMEYIYKFVLDSNSERNFKSEQSAVITKLTNMNDKLKCEILKLNTSKLQLDNEIQTLKQSALSEINEFKKNIDDLNALIVTQKQTMETKKYCMESFKIQINRYLEDNFLCSICNEIQIKSTMGYTCNHSFCEDCIYRWFRQSILCPICRVKINSTTHLKFVDNFIDELFELLGGTNKEQRDILLNERKIAADQNKAKNTLLPASLNRSLTRSMGSARPVTDPVINPVINPIIGFVDLTDRH